MTPLAGRAHIAIIGATTPSHVYPGLAMVRELVRRGHRVTYAIGERLAPLVAETGAQPVPHPTILPGPGGPDAWPEDAIGAMSLFLDEGVAVLPRLLEAYGDDRPDLVLHDIGGFAGPVAAVRWGVPAVQLSPTFVAWKGYQEDMADQIMAMRTAPGADAFYARFGAWLAEHGVGRTPDEVMGRPERGLVLIARALQPNADRVGPAFRFVGPCLDERRLDPAEWSAPAGDGPLLYVSFGTAYTAQLDVYRACVEAFGGRDWRVVLSIGRHLDPAQLGPLPAGVAAHRSVPQLAVLREAAAFVTHAGMGSAMEALWFGVPMVAIPQAVDQFANAARLEELGVGRHLPREDVTVETLRSAVHDVAADPAVAARLAVLRADVRAHGGAGRAADEVERILAG